MKGLSFRSIPLFFFCAAILAVSGCAHNASTTQSGSAQTASQDQPADSNSSPASAPAPTEMRIPAGTRIHVILDATLSSRDSRAGDSFEASLADPIVIDGVTVAGRNARVRGTVVEARSSGRLDKPGLLSVALTGIHIDGQWVGLHTHPLTIEGKSHKKRDLIAIGGGSALGAIIGGIAGGGKGAAIGAGAGAGAGTVGAAATGKIDVSMPAESHLTFRLSTSTIFQAG